jgi:squalene-hopene/tetraprenyl-beta-curcumene cyclase
MQPRIATLVALAVTGLVSTQAGASAPDPRSAVARSLDAIEREGFAWMEGRVRFQDGKGCVSCHHVGYGVWSLREAARQGIERPNGRADLLERRALDYVSPGECRAFSCAALLLARAHRSEEPETLALAAYLEVQQEEGGRWAARGQFPTQRRPIAESDAAATMWVLLAQEGLGARTALRDRLADAKRWLRDAEAGESTEWLLLRWLVERRAGDAAAAEGFRRRLLERQHEDGGWPWRPAQASDAMTTGQVVYGLAIAGDPEWSRIPLQQAVAHLCATQADDGTWVTPSELISTKPSPGKDYVYTYWGTTWAAIGLSRALDVLDER